MATGRSGLGFGLLFVGDSPFGWFERKNKKGHRTVALWKGHLNQPIFLVAKASIAAEALSLASRVKGAHFSAASVRSAVMARSCTRTRRTWTMSCQKETLLPQTGVLMR